MGSSQGLAKYQARRINAPVASLSGSGAPKERQSSGLFNQVPSSLDVEVTTETGVDAGDGRTPAPAARLLQRQPVSEAKAAQLDSTLLALAKRYVEIFQEQASKPMNAAEKSALILEIAVFYSHPSRAGRLETLVMAIDNPPN